MKMRDSEVIKRVMRAVQCPGSAFRLSRPEINPTLDHHLCTGEKHENGRMATTVPTEPCISILAVVPLKEAFNLGTVRSKDGELRIDNHLCAKDVHVKQTPCVFKHALNRPKERVVQGSRSFNVGLQRVRHGVEEPVISSVGTMDMWESRILARSPSSST